MAVNGIDTARMRLFPIERYGVTAVDGDTLLLIGDGKKIRVRLAGIDAPEVAKPGLSMGQTGAAGSLRYLQMIITKHRHELRLFVDPTAKTHGRIVGVLVVGERNINLELVQQGLATAYKPKQGVPGMNFKAFSKAESQAVSEGRGIYGSKFFQAKYAYEQKLGRRLTNVALANPDAGFQARVHGRVIRGMAGGDHRGSTFGGFIGMNPGRLDFTASRDPVNTSSMNAIQAMFANMGVRHDLLMSFDIETTGLDFADVTTFAGFADVTQGSAPQTFETFINPKVPLGTRTNALKTIFNKQAEHKYRRRAAQSALHSGGQMTNELPTGARMNVDWVEQKLRESGMSAEMRQEQMKAMKGAAGIDPEDFMRQLFSKFKGKKNGWVFIHNAQFESLRMGPAIPEDVWKHSLESGDLAAGNVNRRYLYTPFDKKLEQFKRASRNHFQKGETSLAADAQAAWMDRFAKIFRNDPTVGNVASGVKIIDTQDIAKGVFAKAYQAGYFKPGQGFSTHGLISQDALTTMMGMGSEIHMPVADAQQNLEMVARLMGMHEEIQSGTLSKETKAFFTKAQTLQKDMQTYSLFRDVSNQLRNMKTGQDPLQFEIPMRGDVPEEMIHPEGRFFLGGKETDLTGMPDMSFPRYLEGKVPAVKYVEKRIKDLGLDLDAAEVIELVHGPGGVEKYGAKHTLSQTSPSQMIEALSSKQFTQMAEFMPRHEAILSVMAIKKVEASIPSKSKSPLNVAAIPGAKNLQEFWHGLQPKTKTVAKGLGVAAAVIGVLGLIRGATDKTRDAQPQSTYSMEEYMAMKGQGVHANHDPRQLSSMVASYRMVQNRYPTKVS